MARIHLLVGGSDGSFTAVVHTPVPGTGNNAAGVQWRTALANSGLNKTSMTTGNGPGQITTAEANSVANGSVLETTFPWFDNPLWTPAEKNANLNETADRAVAEATADFQKRLNYFGYTVT